MRRKKDATAIGGALGVNSLIFIVFGFLSPNHLITQSEGGGVGPFFPCFLLYLIVGLIVLLCAVLTVMARDLRWTYIGLVLSFLPAVPWVLGESWDIGLVILLLVPILTCAMIVMVSTEPSDDGDEWEEVVPIPRSLDPPRIRYR